jgi:hypothetical protein
MRNIFMSKLGRASAIFAIAGSALLGAGATAEARDVAHWGGHLNGHQWAGHGYYHAPYHAYNYGYGYHGWYRPYYYAPPPVVYPPVVTPYGGYYGPPSLNFGFNVPL